MLNPPTGSLPFLLLSFTARVSTIVLGIVGYSQFGMLAVTAVGLLIFSVLFEVSMVAALFLF